MDAIAPDQIRLNRRAQHLIAAFVFSRLAWERLKAQSSKAATKVPEDATLVAIIKDLVDKVLAAEDRAFAPIWILKRYKLSRTLPTLNSLWHRMPKRCSTFTRASTRKSS